MKSGRGVTCMLCVDSHEHSTFLSNKQTCRCSVADVCQMELAPGELVQEPRVDSPEQNVVLGQSTFQLGNVL